MDVVMRFERANQNHTLRMMIGAGYIRYGDERGEIVYWDQQEWQDDPDVARLLAHLLDAYSPTVIMEKYSEFPC